jgi:hypothetical protein
MKINQKKRLEKAKAGKSQGWKKPRLEKAKAGKGQGWKRPNLSPNFTLLDGTRDKTSSISVIGTNGSSDPARLK